MFHVKPFWKRAASYAQLDLDRSQCDLLERYGEWLATEGYRSGGIGPSELERIDRRHLADSLLFTIVLPIDCKNVWDLGSGIGLPGIPLAIAHPGTRFTLIDRSGRRIDLLRRAIRVLGLQNCQAVQGDIGDLEGPVESIVSRACMPPEQLEGIARRLLSPGGVAVTGGSWRERPEVRGWETVEIPEDVLDQTVWLLIMRRE